MTREDLIQGLGLIGTAYPNFVATEDVASVWWMVFADADRSSFFGAIKQHLQTSKFAPAISEINELVTSAGLQPLDPAMEFERVRLAVRKFGWANPKEAEKFLGEETWHAVRQTGGFEEFCLMTDNNRQFIKRDFEGHLSVGQRRKQNRALLGEAPLQGRLSG